MIKVKEFKGLLIASSINSNITLSRHSSMKEKDHETTYFCRIRDGGNTGRPPPPINFEGRHFPQQTIYYWKGNLSKSPIHFRYRQNVLISRLHEQFLRNAPQGFRKKFQTFKI